MKKNDFRSELDYVQAICWTELDAEPVWVHMELLRIRYRLSSSQYLALVIQLLIRELGYFQVWKRKKLRSIREQVEQILNVELGD